MEKRSPSGTLGKNLRQAGHPIRTALLVTNTVSASHNLLASLRGLQGGSPSGTVLSLRAPPVGQLLWPVNYHVLISFLIPLLRSLLPRSLRSLWSAWSLRFGAASLIAARQFPVHPLPHNVRHPPVAPQPPLFDLASVPLRPNNQGRAAASCPATSFVGLSPSSTGRHMAEVAGPPGPSVQSYLLLSRPGAAKRQPLLSINL